MPINYLKHIQLGRFNETDYRINPANGVDTVIEGYYVFSKDPDNDTHLIFNDGFPVIVFLPNEDDSITVTTENDRFEIKSAWVSAGAIKNVYVKYNNNTSQVFIIRFFPAAFYQLFGLESQYFRNRPILSFQEIAGNNNFSIKTFFTYHTIGQKIEYVETYIQNSLAKIEAAETLNKTLNYIHKTKGLGTVRKLSNDVGVNYKWLERSFVKNIGLLPKEYLQLQRFMHAYLGLTGNQEVNLMDTALSNGYYDYNHFLKDFKAYTGKTPLAYLKLYL
ncbi:helix-turn-helix domain-containing protein [Pedobacter nyackensis]|uniref:helix-turn-helix domain-containing protein n=1 Tax=Pedobacter nyackensis TaxID=475255 RepID=UPI0029317950|nr:helix-turn-helix domain-containing protein [Pedobacter nyackensis]